MSRKNYTSCEKKKCTVVWVGSHLCYSDALWVEHVQNVIGQHQINDRTFIHMHSKVLAVVPRK